MDRYEWLIWSNEHSAWWASNHNGYVILRSQAGRYSFDEACGIVARANKHQGQDHEPNEAMIRHESMCCGAPMVHGGVQCEACGSDGS